jgi:cobalamin biosynthesis Mg chelatase CobN
MDSMSRANNTAIATSAPTSTKNKTPENASAHVIDLKNAQTNFSDSPLLKEGLEEKKVPVVSDAQPAKTGSTKSITFAPDSEPQESSSPSKSVGVESKSTNPNEAKESSSITSPSSSDAMRQGPSNSTPEAEKTVDELNLSDSSSSKESTNTPVAKKSSKLKVFFIVLATIILIGIIAGAVLYILNSTTKPF